MQYFGAADYFFWQGVFHAICYYNYKKAMSRAPTFHMDNATTKACSEAFKWGVCFGLAISEKEYVELTIYPETVKIIVPEIEEEKMSSNPNIVGTC